jgi:hypothetical protein
MAGELRPRTVASYTDGVRLHFTPASRLIPLSPRRTPHPQATTPDYQHPCSHDIRGGRVVGVVSEQKAQMRRGCSVTQLRTCSL